MASLETIPKTNNEWKSLAELDKYLGRGKLSKMESFQLPRDLRMLVQQDTLQSKSHRNVKGLSHLYSTISKGLISLSEQVIPAHKAFFLSAAEFWRLEAEAIESMEATSSNRRSSRSPRRYTSTASPRLVAASRTKSKQMRKLSSRRKHLRSTRTT